MPQRSLSEFPFPFLQQSLIYTENLLRDSKQFEHPKWNDNQIFKI